jgi:hypothetical protein
VSDVDVLLDEIARLRTAIEQHRQATVDECDVLEGRDLELWLVLESK